MALPDDVTTFELTFGPYTDAEGVVTVGAAKGKLFPVDPATGEPIRLTHIATGQVILPSSVGVHLDGETGTATVGPLPHTDNAGLSTVGFAYRVEWDIASSKPSPGNKTFAVPSAAGATADFDLLDPAAAVPGILVPVVTGATGATGAPGVADDASVAAMVADSSSATAGALRVTSVAAIQDAIAAGDIVAGDVTQEELDAVAAAQATYVVGVLYTGTAPNRPTVPGAFVFWNGDTDPGVKASDGDIGLGVGW